MNTDRIEQSSNSLPLKMCSTDYYTSAGNKLFKLPPTNAVSSFSFFK